MKRVTRDIDPGSARDLLERVPRACMAFACDEGPLAQPVELVWREGRYLAGFPAGAERLPDPGEEAVILVDEGIYYFDLRAIFIRGQVQPVEAPNGAPAGYAWFELVPLKTVAWDYGTLREVPGES